MDNLIALGPNILSAIALLLVAVIDRYLIRKGTVQLVSIKPGPYRDEFARFELEFNSNQRFIKSELTYTVRDKEHPTTVIQGKSGTLDFSKKGLNREFLLIDKKLLCSGPWIVDVKVTTTGSRLNPLHKIFPIETHIKQEVEITL
jgi:hypothetical protein